jgi:hypothetical protein
VIPVSDLVSELAKEGVLGLLLALSLIWLYMKDREVIAEKNARIADARALTDLALKMQQQGIDQVQKIHEVFEELKRARGLR